MPGHPSDSTRPDHHAEDRLSDAAEPAASFPQRLDRMAELVALGDMPFPQNLDDAQRALLAREVRQRRRRRLVRFIVRAIAAHLADPRGGK